MSRRLALTLIALAVIDLVVGAWLLVWPGAWQELVHPLAMGTVFYPLQRQGVVGLGRAALEALTARRPTATRLAMVTALWAVEVPAALLVAWRTADTGPLAAAVHLGVAALALAASVGLWRARRALDANNHGARQTAGGAAQ